MTSEDSDLPETVLQFGGDNPRSIIQQQILERNPNIRERTQNQRSAAQEETEEQRQKRADKKARNRAAARKCREKKEQRAHELELEVADLEKEKEDRQGELDKLKRQVFLLQRQLDTHHCLVTNNNSLVVDEDIMNLETAADTPTDDNERSFRILCDFHTEPPVHQEAMDDALAVDDLAQRPDDDEEEDSENGGTLNTPVVNREIYFDL